MFKVIKRSKTLIYVPTRNKNRFISEKKSGQKYHFNSLLPNGINLAESNKEFYALYPTICSDLQELHTESFNSVFERLNYAIRYNILNRNYRTCFPVINAYGLLVPDGKETVEKRKLAYVLDWCVELLVSSSQLIDDMMDHSKNRWNKKCWFLIPDIGKSAICDIKMMEMGVYVLLQKYFSEMPYYKHMFDLFTNTYFITALGQSHDVNMSQNYQKHRRLQDLSLSCYTTQYVYKVYHFISRLSVYLGIYLSGQNYSEYYDLIDCMLKRISHLHEMQNDVWDCFGSTSKHEVFGSDICHGKLTWLIATAQTFANSEQMALLQENYGKYDAKSYYTVRQIYIDLDMLKYYQKFKKQEVAKLYKEIDAISDDHIKQVIYQCIDIHDDKDKYFIIKD